MDKVVANLALNPLFKDHPKDLLKEVNVLQMASKEVKRAEKGVKDPARNALSAEDWTELESRVSAYAEAKRDGMPGLVEFGDQPPQPDGSSGGGPSSSSSYYNGWGRSHGPFSATSPCVVSFIKLSFTETGFSPKSRTPFKLFRCSRSTGAPLAETKAAEYPHPSPC